MTAKANSDIHDNELEWLLLESDHAIGNVSCMGGIIATLERNGGHCNPDPDPLFHLHVSRVLAMYRRATAAWRGVPSQHQRILMAHYLGRRISNVGATPPGPKRGKLMLVPALSAELQEAVARAGPDVLMVPNHHGPPVENGCIVGESWQPWPMGVSGQLGELAGVAMQLAADCDALEEAARGSPPSAGKGHLAMLLRACKRGQGDAVRVATRAARDAVRAAHDAWRESQRRELETMARRWLRAG